MLRKAPGDDAQNPRFIETVPRCGYRFIAEVKETSSDALREFGTAQPLLNGNGAKPFVRQTAEDNSLDEKRGDLIPPSAAVVSSIRSRPVLYSIAAVIVGIFIR